jgi:hypothetical protein
MSLFEKAFSLEEASTGKAYIERELTFYGRLTDFTQLEKAISKEHHEQWEIKLPKKEDTLVSGRIRVRKTIPNITDVDKVEYIQTTKTKLDDGKSEKEVAIPTTIDGLEQFRLMSSAGMIKDRFSYSIPDTNLEYEIDLYYKPGAKIGSNDYHEWVKVDLEIKDPNKPFPELDSIPELPITLEDLITTQTGERTPEEEAKVLELYDTVFLTKSI